ncbi:hypothetical protein [Actinacidiphila paucisporea]|nr:hypothetical protein [Actinacidiphila paucisporea]
MTELVAWVATPWALAGRSWLLAAVLFYFAGHGLRTDGGRL